MISPTSSYDSIRDPDNFTIVKHLTPVTDTSGMDALMIHTCEHLLNPGVLEGVLIWSNKDISKERIAECREEVTLKLKKLKEQQNLRSGLTTEAQP